MQIQQNPSGLKKADASSNNIRTGAIISAFSLFLMILLWSQIDAIDWAVGSPRIFGVSTYALISYYQQAFPFIFIGGLVYPVIKVQNQTTIILAIAAWPIYRLALQLYFMFS